MDDRRWRIIKQIFTASCRRWTLPLQDVSSWCGRRQARFACSSIRSRGTEILARGRTRNSRDDLCFSSRWNHDHTFDTETASSCRRRLSLSPSVSPFSQPIPNNVSPLLPIGSWRLGFVRAGAVEYGILKHGDIQYWTAILSTAVQNNGCTTYGVLPTPRRTNQRTRGFPGDPEFRVERARCKTRFHPLFQGARLYFLFFFFYSISKTPPPPFSLSLEKKKKRERERKRGREKEREFLLLVLETFVQIYFHPLDEILENRSGRLDISRDGRVSIEKNFFFFILKR